MLDKPERLYSPKEVLDLFPEGHRTSLRRLKKTARELGCCVKLGNGIGFTGAHIEALWENLSCSDLKSTGKVPIGKFAGRSPGDSYTKALELLTAKTRKNSGENLKRKLMTGPL